MRFDLTVDCLWGMVLRHQAARGLLLFETRSFLAIFLDWLEYKIVLKP